MKRNQMSTTARLGLVLAFVTGAAACGQAPVFDGVMTGVAQSPLTAGEASPSDEESAAQPTVVVVWTTGGAGDTPGSALVGSSTRLEGGDLEDFKIDIPEAPPEEAFYETEDGLRFASAMILVLDHDPGLGEAELNHKQVVSMSEDFLMYLDDEVPLNSEHAVTFSGPQAEGFHLVRLNPLLAPPQSEGADEGALWFHSVNDRVEITHTDWTMFFSDEEVEAYDLCVAEVYADNDACVSSCEDLEPDDEELMNRCADIQDDDANTRCFEDAYAPQNSCYDSCLTQVESGEKDC